MTMTNPVAKVIDISHHQVIPESLKPAAESGIIACIHKLTEGSTYVDPKVQARHWLVLDAGLIFGCYHFLRPGNIVKQAQFFWNKGLELGVIGPSTLLVADHEDTGVSFDDLMLFLKTLEDLSGRVPAIYSGHVIKDQCLTNSYPDKYRLWLCHYSSKPTLPAGCEKYWLWQYTDKADGAPYGIDGNVDLNDIGDATVDEFLAGWSGAHEQPVPPDETVPIVTVNIEIDGDVEVKVVINGEEV